MNLPNEQTCEARLKLNPDHAIFKGHFPEQPIVPGVCMMQMLTEVLSKMLQKKLHLRASSNTKFLSVMEPGVHPEIVLKINILENDAERVRVDSIIHFEDTVFFKFKGIFQ